MNNINDIIQVDGYLVYASTGEKVLWYECDPCKNVECSKTMCRSAENEGHDFGFCSKTNNPNYRKDGGAVWYAVLKTDGDGEPYWGREYVEGV